MSTRIPGRLAEETPFSLAEPLARASVRAEVWQIAWPSVLTFMLMTTNSILDRAFVGHLSYAYRGQLEPAALGAIDRDALAAVGVGGQLLFLLVSLAMAITVGTTALVARFTGADEPDEARTATGQSVALGSVVSILCTAGVYASLGPYLTAVGLAPGARQQCYLFLNMALLSTVPMFLNGVLSSAYRGLGDTRTPLKVILLANCFHAGGDWLLMFGHYGFPRLGMAGAGIALTTSNVVGVVLYTILLRRSPLWGSLQPRRLALKLSWAIRILRIGIPASITALLRNTSLMSFTGILARTAEHMSAVAALPIGLTAESIAFMPGFGYSVAAAALVGQALGAREPDRAERYGWSAAWQAVAIMSLMGVVFFVGAPQFAAVFTNDHAVRQNAVLYLRIMAISEPMLAFGMVLTGALQGAGETVKPAILTAITFWIFRLPVAWLLALRLGYNTPGAWVAMSSTTILGGILTIGLFRNPAWKRVRV